jgi:hypothetical protein
MSPVIDFLYYLLYLQKDDSSAFRMLDGVWNRFDGLLAIWLFG